MLKHRRKRLVSKSWKMIEIGITRRAWIRAMILFGLAATGGVACVSTRKLEVVHKAVPVAGLDKRIDGLRIGVMSDFHAGAFASKENILQAVAVMNEEKPDLIVLLGDFIDAGFHRTRENVEERTYVFKALRTLDAHLGIYAVLGNHDHYFDQDFVQGELAKLPAVILNNRNVSLDNGLAVAGIDDLLRGRPEPLEAIKNLSPASTVIMLSHNPDVNLSLKDEKTVSLVLSGHTHGGQIRVPLLDWAPWVPGCSRYKGQSGLIRETDRRWTFITKGIGTSVVPIRVACPPDVALLHLRRPKGRT